MSIKRKKGTIHLTISFLIESLLCEYLSYDYQAELVIRLQWSKLYLLSQQGHTRGARAEEQLTFTRLQYHLFKDGCTMLQNWLTVLTNHYHNLRATDLSQIPSQCQQVSLFHLNVKSKEELNLSNRKNRCGSQTPLEGYVFTVVVSATLE